MSGRLAQTASKLLLMIGILWILLGTTGCDGNVYVGVSAGPWVGYPYGGYPGVGWGGGVMYGRPIYP